MSNEIPRGILIFKDHRNEHYFYATARDFDFSYDDWVTFHLHKNPANFIHRIKEVAGKEYQVGDMVNIGQGKWSKIKSIEWSDDIVNAGWKGILEDGGWVWLSKYLRKIIPAKNSGPDLGKDAQEEIDNVFKEPKAEKTYTLDEVIAMLFAELKFYKLRSEADKDYYALIETIKENIEKDKMIASLKSWPTDDEVEAQVSKAGADAYGFRMAIRWLKEWKHPQQPAENMWPKDLFKASEIMRCRMEHNKVREMNRDTVDYKDEFIKMIDKLSKLEQENKKP